jgi:DTW domain-containing protein YfiP
MARSIPTAETIEKVMAAVLEEARANDALPEVVEVAMKKLRETNPKAAHAALRAMIEAMAASLPAHKRQKFLWELLAFLEPS